MKTIGREAPADIKVPVPGVSSLHLLVERLGPSRYHIWDLGSTNGTFVNGERISEATVTPGEELRLGSWVFDWSAYNSTLSSGQENGITVTIGRDRGNDLVIPDPRVSSRHAAVITRGQLVLLVDLGSSNGTIVDGRKASYSILGPGSSVRLGSMPVDLMALLAARGSLGNVPQQAVQSVRSAPAINGAASVVDSSRSSAASASDVSEAVSRPDRKPLMVWGGAGAAVVLAILAALFFTGMIWPYWYRPYEDPWPASVVSAGDAVRSSPGLEERIEHSAVSAESAAVQLEFLEAAEDLLNQIDSWRRQGASGELLSVINVIGGFTGQRIPDNFYDLVIESLDYAAPGTGEYLRKTEEFVRDALAAKDGLQAISMECRRLSAEVQGFRNNESKKQMLALEEEFVRLRSLIDRERAGLSSLQSRAGNVVTGASLVRAAVNGAAGSKFGAYIRPQLMEVQLFVARIIQPVEEFEKELNKVVSGVPQNLGDLEMVTAAASRARNSDEEQRKRRARGGPRR